MKSNRYECVVFHLVKYVKVAPCLGNSCCGVRIVHSWRQIGVPSDLCKHPRSIELPHSVYFSNYTLYNRNQSWLTCLNYSSQWSVWFVWSPQAKSAIGYRLEFSRIFYIECWPNLCKRLKLNKNHTNYLEIDCAVKTTMYKLGFPQ